MTGSIYEYFRSQPATLSRLLTDQQGSITEFTDMTMRVRPDRLYLFASGTSLNAGLAAAPLMARLLQIEVTPCASSSEVTVHGERPLGLFVSQEGTSTNTLAALDRWAGRPSLAVAAVPDSPLAHGTDAHMVIDCGVESAGPKTLGYTATVLTLQVAAIEASRALGRAAALEAGIALDRLRQAIAAMPDNVARVEQWYLRNEDALAELTSYQLIGRSVAGHVAREGALKILETMRLAATGYDFEEYLHGPMMAAGRGVGGIYSLPADARDALRMLAIARWHERRGGLAFRVGAAVPDAGDRDVQLRMTHFPDTTPFETVLVPQLIAARLPGKLGIADGTALFEEVSALVATKWNGASS